jgi:hypothetical protein
MDDVDKKNTGGKYRIIPIFEKAVSMAASTKGIKIMMGAGTGGCTNPHGTQTLEFEWLVKHAGFDAGESDSSGNQDQCRSDGLAGPDWIH